MTEKTAKKIGEAYAFAQVLRDTFLSNKDVMSEIFGEHAGNIESSTQAQQDALEKVSETYSMTNIVLQYSEKTATKIMNMGEMYVGDDWDDAAEVLEWMSFFVGGAIVHWQLITGSATEMNDDEFGNVAGVGTEYYAGLMDQLRSYSVLIGKQRARD